MAVANLSPQFLVTGPFIQIASRDLFNLVSYHAFALEKANGQMSLLMGQGCLIVFRPILRIRKDGAGLLHTSPIKGKYALDRRGACPLGKTPKTKQERWDTL